MLAVLPIYHRLVETKACLTAFSLTDLHGIDLTVAFAVNGAGSEMLEYLEEVCARRTVGIPAEASTVVTYLMLDNPGKGASVNTVVKQEVAKQGKPFDFVLSLDSDLVSHNPRWLRLLLEGYYRASVMRRVGAVVSDQTVNCCHVPLSPLSVGYAESALVFADGNNGIAGGCLLTPYRVWEALGGYKGHRVYGSDDGHYMQAMCELGYRACIVRSCALEHPMPKDAAYQDWKVRACKDGLAENEVSGYKFRRERC